MRVVHVEQRGERKKLTVSVKIATPTYVANAKNPTKKFQDLHNHSFVSVDKTLPEKPSDVSSRFSNLSTKPSIETPTTSTAPSSTVSDDSSTAEDVTDSSTKPSSISMLSTAGLTLETNPSDSSRRSREGPSSRKNGFSTFLDGKLKFYKRINVKLSGDMHTPAITGCSFLPDGKLAVKILDRSLSLKDSLELLFKPRDVAPLDESDIAVTCPGDKKIQILKMSPALQRGITFSIEKECSGIDIVARQMYISCYNMTRKDGEVRVFDIRGKEKKRYGLNQGGSYMFKRP